MSINVLKMEFVVPDVTYNNGENPDAEALATDLVGVSNPRPVVVLDEISEYDLGIGDTWATVTLSGVVRDAIADNIPRTGKTVSQGGVEIEELRVYVDGATTPATTVSLSGRSDGAAAFWRQHPYRADFGYVAVNVPLCEGIHTLRVETSGNAVGNTGFDELAVALEKRVVPGTSADGGGVLPINLFIPQDLTETQADTMRFYYGDRAPILPPDQPADPEFTENPGGEASLVFHGQLADVQVAVTITKAFQAGEWVTTQGGTITLDQGSIDKLRASVVYVFSDGPTMAFNAVFAETLADSGVFRATVPVSVGEGQTQMKWVSKVDNRGGSGPGFYTPMTVRLKLAAVESVQDSQIEILGATYGVEKHGEFYFLKGESLHILATRHLEGPFMEVLLWDSATQTTQWKLIREDWLEASLVRAGTVTLGVRLKTKVYVTSIELHEAANPMNRIPNDYVFPEAWPPENSEAYLAKVPYYPRRPAAFYEVAVDRSQLILVASGEGGNPDPTIVAKWHGASGGARANTSLIKLGIAGPGIYEDDVGEKTLDAQRSAGFALPAPKYALEHWCAHLVVQQRPYPGAIGQVVLFDRDMWNSARNNLEAKSAAAWYLRGYRYAPTNLSYFLGYPQKVDPAYARTSTGAHTLTKGDLWYQWLTHKVGLTWAGSSATIPKYTWASTTPVSQAMAASSEFTAIVKGQIEKGTNFDTLKALPVGATHRLSVDHTLIRWEEEGSSKDLHLAVDRAYLTGATDVTVGPAHAEGDKINVTAVTFSGSVEDLYDFNYFNRPATSGLAAILQAGWKKYDNSLGGPGQVFLTEYAVSSATGPQVYTRR